MITKGQKINDRYEIIKSIGEGGMANVYLAKDIILDRNVAIKILRGDMSEDEKFVRRFQREALSASSLSHPNIVEMYDVGEDNGSYYIVMEYVTGMTLKQLIKKRNKVSLSEAIDIMLQITDGMKEAHDSYIIHRDLKPQNILIQDNGEIKITDFGIAMALNSTQLTQTNSVMGSVHYLPPEQASGKGATIKSDIYSMGILFYELLTGNLPFKGENAVEIALKHMKEDIPSVKAQIETIPQSVENVILKATAKNPKNRYESSKEMHEDLLTCLNEERLNEAKVKFNYPEHDGEDEKEKEKNINIIGEDNLEETKEMVVENILEDSKTKNTWIWVVVIVFALIILAVVGILFIYPIFATVPDVVIPNVAGMTVTKAEDTLKDYGFNVALKIEEVSDDEIGAGLIVKTNPSIGRKVKKGTEIVLYESVGSAVYEMEDFVGKNYIEAKTILTTKYNITVEVEKVDIEEEVEDNQLVIKQKPDVGTKVTKGDKVILYIPNVVDEYPDFVDGEWTIEGIQEFCDQYGVNVNFKKKKTNEYKEGTILSQSRNAGDPIVVGATINIFYAVKDDSEEEVEENKETTETKEENNN